jgi:5-methylcytosine-specific restriction endonuclease McrA
MLKTLDGFFTVLRKRAQQKEMGTKIYSKIRNDKIKTFKYHVNMVDTQKIWDIQGGECYYCGKKLGSFYERSGYQLDHLKPLSLEGQHSPLNLVITCIDCNLRKCMKTEEEFFKVLSRTRDDSWLIKRQETITKIKKEICLAFPLTHMVPAVCTIKVSTGIEN